MITTDLKLIVNVAWANRDGQVNYPLCRGEFAAAERLVKRALLMNCGAGKVGITTEGEKLVKQLCDKVTRVWGK